MREPSRLGTSAFSLEYSREQNIVRRYDELVFWLSATGEGSWDSFVNACRVLRLISDAKQARYIFRRLVLLGYAELSKDGSRWCVCPSTIVQKPTDAGSVYLSGQRVPSLLEELSTFTLVESPQPETNGPSRIDVSCDATTLSESFKQKKNLCLQNAGVASLKLAELLPHYRGWVTSLPSLDGLITANYEIKKWDGEKYLPSTTLYERNGNYYGDSGLYQLTKDLGTAKYRLDLYFDAPQQKWLKGDWYGLRFIANHAAGEDSKAILNIRASTLAVKAKSRWPLIYERALVLASGLLPSAGIEPGWLVYQGISIELAQILTTKLQIPLNILGDGATVQQNIDVKMVTAEMAGRPTSIPRIVIQRACWLAQTAEFLKNRHGAATKPVTLAVRRSLKQLEFLPCTQKLCTMASAPAPLIPHFEALARAINRLDLQQHSSQTALDQ